MRAALHAIDDTPRRTFAVLPLVLAVLGACGGATEYAMVGSADVDSVHGTLEVEGAEGESSLVTVVLDELPPPARLGDEYTTYVAWAKPREGEPVAVGALDYAGDARRGTLSGTAPFRRFTFLVTAESSATPAAPSSLVVAEHRVVAED